MTDGQQQHEHQRGDGEAADDEAVVALDADDFAAGGDTQHEHGQPSADAGEQAGETAQGEEGPEGHGLALAAHLGGDQILIARSLQDTQRLADKRFRLPL